jgi:hypothetical protein
MNGRAGQSQLAVTIRTRQRRHRTRDAASHGVSLQRHRIHETASNSSTSGVSSPRTASLLSYMFCEVDKSRTPKKSEHSRNCDLSLEGTRLQTHNFGVHCHSVRSSFCSGMFRGTRAPGQGTRRRGCAGMCKAGQKCLGRVSPKSIAAIRVKHMCRELSALEPLYIRHYGELLLASAPFHSSSRVVSCAERSFRLFHSFLLT